MSEFCLFSKKRLLSSAVCLIRQPTGIARRLTPVSIINYYLHTMNFNLQKLVRNNIKQLTPYSSARDEFTGTAQVSLDANENSLGSPLLK